MINSAFLPLCFWLRIFIGGSNQSSESRGFHSHGCKNSKTFCKYSAQEMQGPVLSESGLIKLIRRMLLFDSHLDGIRGLFVLNLLRKPRGRKITLECTLIQKRILQNSFKCAHSANSKQNCPKRSKMLDRLLNFHHRTDHRQLPKMSRFLNCGCGGVVQLLGEKKQQNFSFINSFRFYISILPQLA